LREFVAEEVKSEAEVVFPNPELFVVSELALELEPELELEPAGVPASARALTMISSEARVKPADW
jgi:hypothetical protein